MTQTGLSRAHLTDFFAGIAFPARPADLAEQAEQNGADRATVDALRQMPDHPYESIHDVMMAFSAAR